MQELRAQIQAQLRLADHLRKLGEQGGLIDSYSVVLKISLFQALMKRQQLNLRLSEETLRSIRERLGRNLKILTGY